MARSGGAGDAVKDFARDHLALLVEAEIFRDALGLAVDFRGVDDGELSTRWIPEYVVQGEYEGADARERRGPVGAQSLLAMNGGGARYGERSGAGEDDVLVEVCQDRL